MRPALGSLTSLLCVKITLSFLRFMLLWQMCPTAYKDLYRVTEADGRCSSRHVSSDRLVSRLFLGALLRDH